MSNVNIQDDNNTYIKTGKNKYCDRCGRKLPEEFEDCFCDFYCKQEFYAEKTKELTSCYREWVGLD